MCSLYRLSVLLHYSIVFIKMYYKLAKVNHLAEHDGALLAYDVKLLVSRMPATANKRFCLFTLFWAKTTEQTFKGSPLFWLPKNVNQIQSESKIFTSDSARHKGAGLLKGIVQNHLQALLESSSHSLTTCSANGDWFPSFWNWSKSGRVLWRPCTTTFNFIFLLVDLATLWVTIRFPYFWQVLCQTSSNVQ